MTREAQTQRSGSTDLGRLRVLVRGAVQGVGFRPFVYRLAHDLSLAGHVLNTGGGVVIEVEGPDQSLDDFLLRLQKERPPRAVIQGLEPSRLDPTGASAFEILASAGGEKSALVLPDIATCPDCLADLFDPRGRRFRYPFTNCTNCGPRFTIIRALPYDRPATTMAGFRMCERCLAEYEDPRDRRFHAQPNACPTCGPRLALWDAAGTWQAGEDEALCQAARLVGDGGILALKGLGGFHLIVDARNDGAVRRLRQAKAREEKPFAIMCPDREWAERLCHAAPLDRRLLESAEAPIVLMRRREGDREGQIAASVAPGHPLLGVMVPYTPLHHLLLREIGRPVVATSGNRSDEPICTDEHEAVDRLAGLCDAFLVHDRPIVRPVDDSILRVVLGRELVLRRARGYAPLPVSLPTPCPDGEAVLAVGAHLKSAVALGIGRNGFVSQHLGDLETPEAFAAFGRAIDTLNTLYDARPARVACDAHPHYRSTEYAEASGAAATRVPHHIAHVLACMAENEVEEPALGVAWDGTGFGLDDTVWGGEWFLLGNRRVRRLASLRTFRLPGGDQAVREPRRSAAGLLFEHLGPSVFERRDLAPLAAFAEAERRVLSQMLARGLHSPLTSSVGRLFDAVASLIDLRHRVRYEGQAAMELEFAAQRQQAEPYPFALRASPAPATTDVDRLPPQLVLDWGPSLDALLEDVARGVPGGVIAARFHAMLAAGIVAVATAAGERSVLLSGGCFQNAWLTECTVRRLRDAGFKPYWHQRVPPNDGGIALGQLVAVAGGWSWTSNGTR